jgi:VanZ family protein
MTRSTIIARTLFWLALVVAVTMAVLPHPPHTPLDQFGDKFEHMTAFTVMSVLAAIGYRSAPLPRIGERLSFLGALIEVVQSIPALHRDCDIRDWIADTIAITVTLLIVAAVRKSRATPSAT